jgi:hypothetical protein
MDPRSGKNTRIAAAPQFPIAEDLQPTALKFLNFQIAQLQNC